MGIEETQERHSGSVKNEEAQQLSPKLKKCNESILEQEKALANALKSGYRGWTKASIQTDGIKYGFRLGVKIRREMEEKRTEDENKVLLNAMDEAAKRWLRIPTNKNAFLSGFHKGVSTESEIQKKNVDCVCNSFEQVKADLISIRDLMEERDGSAYVKTNSLILNMLTDKEMVAAFGSSPSSKKEERETAIGRHSHKK